MLRSLTVACVLAAAVVAVEVAPGVALAGSGETLMRPDASVDEVKRALTRGISRRQQTGPASTSQPAIVPEVSTPSTAATVSPARPNREPARQTAAAESSTSDDGGTSFRILFAYNSANLTPDAIATLDTLGKALASAEMAGYRFRVEGHTDATGGEDYNLQLSDRRARAVYEYLVTNHGIDPSRLEPVGMGEADLFNASNPYAGENRRVRLMRIDG